jgi:hypothetical protein
MLWQFFRLDAIAVKLSVGGEGHAVGAEDRDAGAAGILA